MSMQDLVAEEREAIHSAASQEQQQEDKTERAAALELLQKAYGAGFDIRVDPRGHTREWVDQQVRGGRYAGNQIMRKQWTRVAVDGQPYMAHVQRDYYDESKAVSVRLTPLLPCVACGREHDTEQAGTVILSAHDLKSAEANVTTLVRVTAQASRNVGRCEPCDQLQEHTCPTCARPYEA